VTDEWDLLYDELTRPLAVAAVDRVFDRMAGQPVLVVRQALLDEPFFVANPLLPRTATIAAEQIANGQRPVVGP
jgi:hypothetical protein